MLVLGLNGFAQSAELERHIDVSMRMIGHEVLLSLGDSTSRVLPIKKVDERYRISFASDFEFIPEDLAATIDSVIEKTNMANSYLVEVEDCDTREVVYSYEVAEVDTLNILPCRTRDVPRGCYSLLISILDGSVPSSALSGIASSTPSEKEGQKAYMLGLLFIPFSALIALLIFRRRREKARVASSEILIGEYRFDKRNMELSIDDQKMELTSKETDLLYLLYSCANDTVEREVMLKEVWGNEGDYVGRTLDVFISKLRKKLEADPKVRIANIRGVGYKLILND